MTLLPPLVFLCGEWPGGAVCERSSVLVTLAEYGQ